MNSSLNEFQAYEALYKYQGARIEFCNKQVTYQGIIDEIFPIPQHVRLRHTKVFEEGVQGDGVYMGTLRFKFNDFSSFKVIESSESVNKYPKNEYLLNILRNNQPERSDIITKALCCPDESDDEQIEEKFILNLPEHLEHQITKNFKIIDTDEGFHPAIQCVANEQVIGVSFHGQEISRFGKLMWICIYTEQSSFLFDVQQLSKEAFDNGLKDIFESNSIKKVIHDCWFPADCLAHQYSTSLSNVFDTRIADFVLSVQRYNEQYKLYSYNSLDMLLRTYLNVPQEFINQQEVFQSNATKRPITNAYLFYLLKSVLFLKLLKETLCRELLTPFHKAVDFYRTLLVDSAEELIDSLGSDLSTPDRMPKGLLMHGIQTALFQNPKKMENLPLKCTFIHPKTGEVIRSCLGTSVANKNALLSQQNRYVLNGNHKVNETHEPPTQEKKGLCSKGASKASSNSVPYLGSVAALMDSLRKNKENNQELLSQKHVENEQRAASEVKTNFFLANDILEDLSSPSENFNLELENECLKKPNFGLLDAQYHRLANRIYPNVEELSFFFNPSTSSDSFAEMSSKNTDYLSEFSISSSQSDSGYECSDMWSKLREETIAENNLYSCHSERKFHYAPG